MDGYQFVSSLIDSLAWPAAVVWMAFLLKGPVAKLIPRVRTFKYGEFQVDIGEKLEEAKELVSAIDTTGAQESHEVEDRSVAFQSIAETNPRTAILIAWTPVEVELTKLAAKAGVTMTPGMPTRIQLKPLEEEGLLNRHLVDTIAKLQSIRNAATNVLNTNISIEDATNMEQMCSVLTAQLKVINEST